MLEGSEWFKCKARRCFDAWPMPWPTEPTVWAPSEGRGVPRARARCGHCLCREPRARTRGHGGWRQRTAHDAHERPRGL